ncbi:MAG: hypothetical protein ABIR57_05110 [Aeromicrobium sp.]
MSNKWMAGAAALVLVSGLSACGSPGSTLEPTGATTTKAPDISQHQSGPESPIAYGFQVPKGATQLGPLVRFRSARLIKEYRPQLDAAIAQEAADAAAKAAQDLKDGKTPVSPAPSPVNRPYDDTFKLLADAAPKPDTTMSVMRVDGNPSDVVYRMVGQVAAVLPKAGIKARDLSKFCTVKDERITGCNLSVRGLTGGDRDVRVTVSVDPGDVTTRTSLPSSRTRPVMTLLVEYVGEPRKGQIGKDTDGIGDLPDGDKTAPPSSLIWPKMDTDDPSTVALLDGTWKAPDGATILLSGHQPPFAALSTDKGKQADLIAEEWTRSVGDKGEFTKDVVEDLNEVSTTYTAVREDGVRAFATFVLSARGTYAMLFYLPAPTV